MTRERINLTDTTQDVIFKMSEGNPGALNVCVQLLADATGFFTLLNLDDMGIRGSAIWVAYKDHCKEDLSKFIECCKERSNSMIDTVNTAIQRGDCGEDVPLAIVSGASSTL